MGTQVRGTAKFEYSSGPVITVLLGTPLHLKEPEVVKRRYTATSLDNSVIEVSTVGNGMPQVTGLVRLHDDAQELLDMIEFGLDGGTLNYYNVTPSTAIPLRLIAGSVRPDREHAGLGRYEATLTLRRIDGGDLSAML